MPNIVTQDVPTSDAEDVDESNEPQPPESCFECGCGDAFQLLGVDVNGADRQAWVCDNCGYAHILN